MANILVLHSSINLSGSVTRELAAAFIERHQEQNPEDTIVERDLVKTPIPHMPPTLLELQLGAAAPEQPDEYAALAEELISELEKADTVVIGVPMYSFTVPSVLKAWIDYVARAGRTFTYVNGASVGLLQGKKVVLLISAGGIYTSGPTMSSDFTENYLRAVLGFLGLTAVVAIRVEAQGKSGPAGSVSRAKALELIRTM
ncbi:FMN-dependent NADH-azoreductase [Dickeya chrysanthemi]|uniref:FMN-dependent NADH-azoreductase n=1 Tax=Dickeya chrysanthemi TaxID=556 RepID=UPI0005872AE8|nr:NAD(P)H-dependent oxidoreductase [Dickeya chrysanthemi]MBX9448111.1 NAD(P)H-dependent oxidoreductase [Dickeya chrysanthemi]